MADARHVTRQSGADNGQAQRRPPTEVIAIRRRSIRARYRAAARDRQAIRDDSKDSPKMLGNLRMREIERFFAHRYGRYLPDDDGGREDLMIAFDHIAMAGIDVTDRCCYFAKMWTPWLSEAEAEMLAEQAGRNPITYKAARLGVLLGLTEAERVALEIKTIWAADAGETPKQRRKRKDRDRKRAMRATKPKRITLSQSRPWVAEGISRRTWERRRKAAGEASACRKACRKTRPQ